MSPSWAEITSWSRRGAASRAKGRSSRSASGGPRTNDTAPRKHAAASRWSPLSAATRPSRTSRSSSAASTPPASTDERVAGTLTDDGVATDHPPELRDLRLQRVRRLGRLIITPQLVDETIVRDRARRREGEERKERLQLGSGDRHQPGGRVGLDRAEERDRHVRCHEAPTPSCSRRTPKAEATAGRTRGLRPGLTGDRRVPQRHLSARPHPASMLITDHTRPMTTSNHRPRAKSGRRRTLVACLVGFAGVAGSFGGISGLRDHDPGRVHGPFHHPAPARARRCRRRWGSRRGRAGPGR